MLIKKSPTRRFFVKIWEYGERYYFKS